MSRKVLVMVFVLAMGVLTTACAQNAAEKIIENQTGGKVKINSGKDEVEIKGKDGTIKIGKNSLPADFPKDVPVYKPSSIKSSMSSTRDGKKTFVVTLTTSDDLNAIVDFYKKELTDGGWTEKSAFTGGEGGSQFANLGYEKGETMVSITVNTSNDGKETQIVISTTPKS